MQSMPMQLAQRVQRLAGSPCGAAFRSGPRAFRHRLCRPCRAQQEQGGEAGAPTVAPVTPKIETNVSLDLDKEVSKFARSAATTFAPRASTATKNPAYKGSVLYTVFEVQAWLSLVVGGLLSFNLIFPSDQPDIARLLGMWSIWMFTIPSLRARECTSAEKDALNILFLAVPLLNVALPFVSKSFPLIFSADCVLMAAVYASKGLLPFQEGEGGEQQEQQQ